MKAVALVEADDDDGEEEEDVALDRTERRRFRAPDSMIGVVDTL